MLVDARQICTAWSIRSDRKKAVDVRRTGELLEKAREMRVKAERLVASLQEVKQKTQDPQPAG